MRVDHVPFVSRLGTRHQKCIQYVRALGIKEDRELKVEDKMHHFGALAQRTSMARHKHQLSLERLFLPGNSTKAYTNQNAQYAQDEKKKIV